MKIDEESKYGMSNLCSIENVILQDKFQIEFIDTISNEQIKLFDCDNTIKSFLNKFASSYFVITNRLHIGFSGNYVDSMYYDRQ